MSDVSQGPGWWQASDGKWYPPKDADKAPAPGYWLASDGKWYPPVETEKPPAPGYWLAADGKWYPPDKKTAAAKAAAPKAAPAKAAPKAAPAKPAAAKAAPPRPAAAKPSAPRPGIAPGSARGGPARPAAGAQPRAAGRPAAAPAPKPAPAKPAAAARPAAPAASTAAASHEPGINGTAKAPAGAGAGFGLNPVDQIRIRNEQSKKDAQVLAGARRMAATRALGSLQSMIDDEKAAQGRELRESPAMREREAAANASPPAAKASPGPSSRPAPPAAKPAPTTRPAAPAAKAPPAAAPSAPATAAPAGTGPMRSNEPPLLEVKQGALAADVEHIGERLAIFNDRVELHDRNDRVRQTILGNDIADVVVHKKFTGSTVTVESGTGETIVAKGLKPDQADEIRALILKRTRQGPSSTSDSETPIAAPPASSRAARPAPAAAPNAPAAASAKPAAAGPRSAGTKSRINESDLVNKLLELHRAGVLSDDELAEKTDLVARLVRGETLASTSTNH